MITIKYWILDNFRNDSNIISKLRNDSNIINVAVDLEDGEVPKLMYHKTCWAQYILKRDFDKLRSEVKESPESKRAKRLESVLTSTSGVLQKIYILCKKANKFIEGVRENLSSCKTFTADKTVKKCAILKNGQKILSTTTRYIMLLAIEDIPFVSPSVKERLNNQKVHFILNLTLLKTFKTVTTLLNNRM